MRYHIDWRGERNTPYKGMKTSPQQMRFKDLESKPERENLKSTISTISRLRRLQMVSEPDIRWCASEDVGL